MAFSSLPHGAQIKSIQLLIKTVKLLKTYQKIRQQRYIGVIHSYHKKIRSKSIAIILFVRGDKMKQNIKPSGCSTQGKSRMIWAA